jgi:hypothetical protein
MNVKDASKTNFKNLEKVMEPDIKIHIIENIDKNIIAKTSVSNPDCSKMLAVSHSNHPGREEYTELKHFEYKD